MNTSFPKFVQQEVWNLLFTTNTVSFSSWSDGFTSLIFKKFPTKWLTANNHNFVCQLFFQVKMISLGKMASLLHKSRSECVLEWTITFQYTAKLSKENIISIIRNRKNMCPLDGFSTLQWIFSSKTHVFTYLFRSREMGKERERVGGVP